jgi:hypothetical protein
MPTVPTNYQFLPWVRRGLTVALSQPETLGSNLPARATAKVGIQLADAHADEAVEPVQVQLYGPGDVVALDTRQVVRTDPRPGITNFEPNYLALVEFDAPDLPWMLTPALANNDNRLRPWLVLVVLDAAKVGAPRMKPPALLPQVRIAAADVADELPALADSWAWAHSQVVSNSSHLDLPAIEKDLQDTPASNLSRLVCPRRLQPNTNYIACVVPAFEPGRLRGLGLAGDGRGAAMQSLAPAWNLAAAADVVLPVYHHWRFSTGARGDFESMARDLRTPRSWAGDSAMTELLAHIGTAPMAVDRLLAGSNTVMEGALVPIGFKPGQGAQAVQADTLRAIVNTAAGLVDTVVKDKPDGSVERIEVKPPLYGAFHARAHSVKTSEQPGWWLAGLNLDPRYRGAAGYGAEVVRKNQEDYVDACWDQIGEIRAAEMKFNLTRLAIEAQQALKAKHFDPLPPPRLMQVMAAALPRIEAVNAQGAVAYKVGGVTASLGGQIDRSSLPSAVFDVALRRAASPQRRTLRIAALRTQGLAQLQTLGTRYVTQMAAAQNKPAAFDVNAFVPDGILGTRLFDGVDLNAAQVDLSARGLRETLSGEAIKGVLAAGAVAKRQFAAVGAPVLQASPSAATGVFADLHLRRLGTLMTASPNVGLADLGFIAEQMAAPGRRNADGFLIEAQLSGSFVQVSALQVDARTGAVSLAKPLGRARRSARGALKPTALGTTLLNPLRPPTRPPGLATKLTLGGVTPTVAQTYGAVGLFANLPANAIDLQPGAVASQFRPGATLQLERIGAEPLRRNVASITLPPLLTQREVLARYADSTRGTVASWASAYDAARVVVQATEFPLALAAQIARARTQPALTLSARLASQVAIADTALGRQNRFVATHLIDSRDSARLRFLLPALMDRVMACPHLREPMYQALADYDQEAFMPGIGSLPDNLIMLVQVNQRFIDAFMVGANVEMNRELLWRGFPTDLRGTPFQRFWGRVGRVSGQSELVQLDDMEPIHRWRRQPLGQRVDENLKDADRIALIVKGRLLRRYPNAHVYAWRRNPSAAATASQLLKNGQGLPPDPDKDIATPVFAGFLQPDVTFFGFDIDRGDKDNWCFVIEEAMAEPRFGFDVPQAPQGQSPATVGPRPRALLSNLRERLVRGDAALKGFNAWKALAWSDLGVAAGAHFDVAALQALGTPQNRPFASFPPLPATPTAANIARSLLQEPFRGYWEGPDLVV